MIFSTLCGRKINFLYLLDYLKILKGIKVIETTEFIQGKMIRWGLSWSFYCDFEDFFNNNPLIGNNKRYDDFKYKKNIANNFIIYNRKN